MNQPTDLHVYVNGQESQFDYDHATAIMTVKKITLDGEPIPPIPGAPFGSEYHTVVMGATVFVPVDTPPLFIAEQIAAILPGDNMLPTYTPLASSLPFDDIDGEWLEEYRGGKLFQRVFIPKHK